MKSRPIMAIIWFLFFAGRICSGRLLENNLFIPSDNPLAFDPNLKSILNDGLEKDAVLHCDQEIGPRSSSWEKNGMKDENKLSFRLSPRRVQNKNKVDKSPGTNNAEGVFHVLPKGKVTPSGPSPKVNPMVTEQRLSKSKRSRGVGHMQTSSNPITTMETIKEINASCVLSRAREPAIDGTELTAYCKKLLMIDKGRQIPSI